MNQKKKKFTGVALVMDPKRLSGYSQGSVIAHHGPECPSFMGHRVLGNVWHREVPHHYHYKLENDYLSTLFNNHIFLSVCLSIYLSVCLYIIIKIMVAARMTGLEHRSLNHVSVKM